MNQNIRHINSLTNPVIKSLRALHDRKRRKASGVFLAEGMRIVTEAFDLGWVAEHLVFLEGREDDAMVRRLINKAQANGADIIMVNEAVLSKVSRKDNPQMVLASFSERWADPGDVFTRPSQAQQEGLNNGGCWLALDRVRDPGNLGTILRTADATQAAGVVLIGDCCDAYSVEAVRASMGAIFNIPMVQMSEAEFIAHSRDYTNTDAKGYGGEIIGTALPASVDYRAANWQAPMILMMGNEQAGLTENLMASATQLIRMPMLGRSDSLNLAVATGVALYEYRRHQNGDKT